MRIAIQLAAAIAALVALGFCVAFAIEEMLARVDPLRARAESAESAPERVADTSLRAMGGVAVLGETAVESAGESALVDALFEVGAAAARYRLETVLPRMAMPELEDSFVDLMSRDLEDARSVEFARRVLQELARRAPERGASLLSAMAPAEREKLAASLARGWVAADAASAFDWIESAWIDPEGNYIDRALQNRLYIEGVDTLLVSMGDFDQAARRVESLVDPALKRELVALLARRVVADGPERALDRMSASRSDTLDTAIFEAISVEWSARDPLGAMEWSLGNQDEVSPGSARAVAKQLALNELRQPLGAFHKGLEDRAARDSVAAEAARLLARREPVASADWALAIESAVAKFAAVQDALYEIGYERFDASVDYIDYVYRREEPERMPVLYSTLKDWVAIDRPAVEAYLESGRAGMDAALARELLAARAL